MVKDPLAIAGDVRDTGSTPGPGRCPGGGHGNPLQYPCLENPMDRGAWRATVPGVADLDTLSARGELVTVCSRAALSDALAVLTVRPVSGTAHRGIGVCPSGPPPTRPALAPRSLCSHLETPSLSPGSGCPHSAFRRALLCSLPVFLCLHRSRLNLWSAWGLFWSALGEPHPITVQAATAGPRRSL